MKGKMEEKAGRWKAEREGLEKKLVELSGCNGRLTADLERSRQHLHEMTSRAEAEGKAREIAEVDSAAEAKRRGDLEQVVQLARVELMATQGAMEALAQQVKEMSHDKSTRDEEREAANRELLANANATNEELQRIKRLLGQQLDEAQVRNKSLDEELAKTKQKLLDLEQQRATAQSEREALEKQSASERQTMQ
eukprot:733492-Rhodomonas_salina.1